MLILSLTVDITTTFQRVPYLLVNWLQHKLTFLELEISLVWLTIVQVQMGLVKLPSLFNRLKYQVIKPRVFKVYYSSSMLFQVLNDMLNRMVLLLTLLRFQAEHQVV